MVTYASKQAVASLNSTSNLGSGLPDDLSEMRKLRVGRVVFRDLIGPHLDGSRDAEVSTSGQVLCYSFPVRTSSSYIQQKAAHLRTFQQLHQSASIRSC